ncbi:MAG: hypothetical protein AAF489_15275 [Bacteroidota bacterium]
MEKILHPAATLGTANFDWLHPKYSLRFANYYSTNETPTQILRSLKNGVVTILNKILTSRDAQGKWNTESISITTKYDIRALLIEIPMN